MSQINVNPTPPRRDNGERAAAGGINLITVLVVLAVVIALLWLLFAGPLRGAFGGGTTDVNVNPPAKQEQPTGPKVDVNVPKVDVPKVDVNVPKVEVSPAAPQPSPGSRP
jgi:hypothetical protein